ncbi:hypothetical protein EGW08_003582 [Elysia chlorotica]|uniref:Uncharacterized protein n=1 Tax=Elysia chlorotica TaxID=188477 RepID=A0A433U489_ELYCH|nr:hypothetical protein EGW08_003582 [Elysia chlorotica]
MAHKPQHFWLAVAAVVVLVAVSMGGSSSSSDDDDDKPTNYTCSAGAACDVDSDAPFAYLEGSLYCCREDDIISFTVNLDLPAPAEVQGNITEAGNMTLSEQVQQGFNCTCLDLGDQNLKEKIREAFGDIKDKVGERWDDAKDWLSDTF